MSAFMYMNKDTSAKNIEVATASVRNMSTLVNTMKDTSGKTCGRSASRSKRQPSARSGIKLDRIKRYEFYCDSIRRRAYETFCRRTGRGGDQVSDWLQAERDLSDRDVANGSRRQSELIGTRVQMAQS